MSHKILLNQEKCLILQPEIAKLVGRSAALLFQQLHYWLHSPDVQGVHYHGRKWIYNTYDDWARDLQTVSKTTINRSIRKLKELKLIHIEQLWAKKGNRTNHYTINYPRLEELFSCSQNKGGGESSPSYPKAPEKIILDVPSIHNESLLYRTKNTSKRINPNLSKNSKMKNLTPNTEPPLAQQMIDIWNRIISPGIRPVINPKRARYLIAALRLKFGNSLKRWENYCRQIASSDYLMGKIGRGFQIVLEIALKFDFIQRIFEKQFGVQEIISSAEEIIPACHPSEPSETLPIRQKIAQIVGKTAYQDWFAPAIMEIKPEGLSLGVSSLFARDWMRNNYWKRLEDVLATKISFRILKMAH